MKATMKQGGGWSPDGGRYFVKGDKVYWEDGDIGDLNTGENVPGRIGIGDYQDVPDYSLMTDDERAKLIQSRKEAAELRETESKKYYEKRALLIESAKAKITQEEYEAIFEEGRDY